MLTDSASQFEMKGVNDIPKSFQKLLNEIQNVNQNKKQSKNLSLDVKTMQKNSKNLTTIKKKKKTKQSKPLEIYLEKPDKSNVSKNSVQILNQTNITEFFNTAKKNLLNRTSKNLEGTEKQEVPNRDAEILSSDDDNFYYSNQNSATDFEKPVCEFQNPDYLSFLSSRNNNPINEANEFEKATESNLNQGKEQNHTAGNVDWKTFNQMNSEMDCDDIIIERKKYITPNIFYSRDKSNVEISSKVDKITNQSGSSLKKNLDANVFNHPNVSKNSAKEWLKLLKDDRERMSTLLNQVKFMNDTITKARQDISKFFINRNN